MLKSCSCGTNEWTSIMNKRIDSLGYEEVLWCKVCGTIAAVSKSNGASQERVLSYQQPTHTFKI